MEVVVVVVVALPDPFLGMGAWPKATEPQEPDNPPRPTPQVNRRRLGAEDSQPL